MEMTKKQFVVAIGIAALLFIGCCSAFLAAQWLCFAPGSCGQGLSPVAPTAVEHPVPSEYSPPGPDKPTANDWDEDIPFGGLGDEELRGDVWRGLQTVVSCPSATAADVFISPLDSTSETWDIWCPNGDVEAYIVFYEKNPAGGMDFVIGKYKEE